MGAGIRTRDLLFLKRTRNLTGVANVKKLIPQRTLVGIFPFYVVVLIKVVIYAINFPSGRFLR